VQGGAELSVPIDLPRLFETHRAGLVAYALAIVRDRATAEDVVQDAWIRIQAAEAGAKADRPDAYLYRTVRNLALDRGRRAAFERRHFIQSPDNIDQTRADEVDPETATAVREELRLTLETLQTLPQRMEAAVRLHRLEGMRLKDIAERLGVSMTVAHELVSEGVDRCRQVLRERSRRR
jgi:RNA polymerase sigma factor (sigma-70 family)